MSQRFRVSKTHLLISAKLVKLCLLGLALLLSGGCGQLRTHVNTAPDESYGEDGYGRLDFSDTGSTSSGDFRCPTHTNVVPDYDWNFNGSGSFTVCTNVNSAYNILVHGSTNESDTICVFPAQYVDATHIYLKADEKGQAKVTCAAVTAGGVNLTYDNTNFNSVYIVEKPFLDQMKACLNGGNSYFCPAYSFGQFR